eukprot:6513088-Pyramimonas_sp.AAC.1
MRASKKLAAPRRPRWVIAGPPQSAGRYTPVYICDEITHVGDITKTSLSADTLRVPHSSTVANGSQPTVANGSQQTVANGSQR